MKHIKLISIILYLFVYTNTAFSQDNKEKSDSTTVINGKYYYIHIVKKSETIYSICKKYNVTEKQLAVENPELFNGLKLGQKLKIFKQTGRPLKKSKDYIYFNIEKGQTVYGITKKYDITAEEFYKYNPGVVKGIKVGQEVRIKKKNKTITHEINKKDIPYIKHKVKKKETLYSISKKYDVSQDDILNANISIKENGLKKGMIINIPTKEFINNALWEARNDSSIKNTVAKDSLETFTDTTKSACNEVIFDKNKTIKIGLLLPFDLDITSLNIEQKKLETDNNKRPKTKPFFEIYQGILLKINELKNQNYNIDLYTFNTKKSPKEIKNILKKPEIKFLDFIIGPIYKNTFDTALKYKPIDIPIINPLLNVESNFNEKYNFIQTEPTNKVVFNKIIDFAAEFNNANYIVIDDGNNDGKSKYNNFSNKLNSVKEDSVKIVNIDFTKTKKLNPFLDKDRVNIVLIFSTKEAFVTNAITKLHISSKKDSVILIGYKEWLKYKIQTEYFHNLNLTLFTNKNVDFKNDTVIKFNKIYKEEYKCEPTNFSYIGYDIANLFFKTFIKHDKEFCKCLNNKFIECNIYKFKFKKLHNHYINTYLYKIQYNKDLTVKSE